MHRKRIEENRMKVSKSFVTLAFTKMSYNTSCENTKIAFPVLNQYITIV
jgi:hypothetical protein